MLFVAKSDLRVYGGGPASGNPAGEQGDYCKEERDERERSDVMRLHVIEQA